MKIRVNRYFPWRTLQHFACRSIRATSVCFTWLYSYTRWLTFAVRVVHYFHGLTTVHRLHPLLRRLLYDEGLLAATPLSRLEECWLFTTTRWKCSYSSYLEAVFFTSNLGKCHVVIKRISSPVFVGSVTVQSYIIFCQSNTRIAGLILFRDINVGYTIWGVLFVLSIFFVLLMADCWSLRY
jgi:hypothetical protein